MHSTRTTYRRGVLVALFVSTLSGCADAPPLYLVPEVPEHEAVRIEKPQGVSARDIEDIMKRRDALLEETAKENMGERQKSVPSSAADKGKKNP